MAFLQLDNSTFLESSIEITKYLAEEEIIYQHWDLKVTSNINLDDVLDCYKDQIDMLKKERHYIHADLVTLNSRTPDLNKICQEFKKEHHHDEDEVRFVIEGEGIFEILSLSHDKMIKITTTPGDLIIIPAKRRHLFHLTKMEQITCMRLFKNNEGWTAHTIR